MMKLSDKTVGILKNFSTINQNILIREGSKLRTMSTMKNILAEADVSEAFPTDFGIYDLNEFLGVLTLAKDADINFDNQAFLTAASGTTKIKYFYSDPSILTTPPETFNAPECDVTFNMSASVLSSVLKASAVMQLPDIVMKSEGSGVEVTATDLKNTSSNNYTESLDAVGSTFEFRFKADNLKMIPGDYTVQASTSAGVSNWKGVEASYWIAMEANTE
jgi:hypothetical protein